MKINSNQIFHYFRKDNFKNFFGIGSLLFASFFGVLWLVSVMAFTPKAAPTNDTGIKWMTFEQAVLESQKNKKKIFIDVYTNWCGWCKKMDAETFSDAKLAAYVNKNFYAVKLDAESGKTFEFRGKSMTERELAGQVFKVNSYPTTVYLDENLDILSPVAGYLDKPFFDKILKFYGENIYLKKSWPDFEKEYKP